MALSFCFAVTLVSCRSSKYPHVSKKEFAHLEQALDDAITIARKDPKQGIANLESFTLLPQLLENRRKYILGLLYRSKNDLAMAFINFYGIDKNYLSKYSLWNLAQISKEIGFEKIVLESLDVLTDKYPKEPKFIYELAKSYARQSNFERARKLFESIQKSFADTDYATGANYYLGNMTGDTAKKLGYFIAYLKKSPDGSFAALISDQIIKIYEKEKESNGENLEAATQALAEAEIGEQETLVEEEAQSKDPILNPNNLKEIENLIALSYFSAEDYRKAAKYFNKQSKEWLEYAKSLGKIGRVQEAIDLIMLKLTQERDEELAKQAIDYLLQVSSRWLRLGRLRKLEPNIKVAKDKILWHIAERTGSKSDYRKVFETYPDSYYAPESMARVFWKEYKRKSYHVALELAEQHWEKYSHARSHPFVAFWRGKALFQLAKDDLARAAYVDLIKEHPRNYYSFRAESILDHGNSNDWFVLPKANQFVSVADWDWPMPYSAREVVRKYGKDVLELINIQQFDFLLGLEENKDFSFDKSFRMWLYAMDENNLKAISTAYFDIKEAEPIEYEDIRHQYSFPLLFSDLVADQTGRRLKLDPMLAHALIKQESRYQPEIVSRVGAIGLMQLMPYTAKSVARQLRLKSPSLKDLRDPETNITLGVKYLEEGLSRFDNNLIFTVASYNAGPVAVQRWIRKYGTADLDMFIEQIPYAETKNYTKKVLGNYWVYKKLYT